MPSAEDYSAYAHECFDCARTARTEKEREIFLQMAGTWREAAARASAKARSIDQVPDNDNLQTAE